MNNTSIDIKKWLELKPYEMQVSSDAFYVELSKELKQAILAGKHSVTLKSYLVTDEVNSLACFLTAYLEDIVSGTNLWCSFINYHTKLYRKPLPFYQVENYDVDKINIQDIGVLVWYFINTIQEDVFIPPLNDLILDTAEQVYDVLEEAHNSAPKNEQLKEFYTIDEDETDFYEARELIDNILFKTYLFYPDTKQKLMDSEIDIYAETKGTRNLQPYLNENWDQLSHKSHTKLLSLTGKEWASIILGNEHALANDYLNILQKITGYFFYKGQDLHDIYLEHIASGKKFKLTKKSFDHSRNLTKVDTIIFMGIAKWRNEWWFSGVHFQTEFNADLVMDEKNSLESRHAVSFLDHQKQDMNEVLGEQLKAFKDYNEGRQIAFLKSEDISEFFNGYWKHYNDSLDLSNEEREEVINQNKADGFFSQGVTLPNFTEVADSGLVFFNPKSGVEIALDVNSAFPLPSNPFFDEEKSEAHVKMLLLNDQMSEGLVRFCIDNCKSKLPLFNDKEGEIYLSNIDFLLRFWKNDSYFSEPSITFTGVS